MEASLVFPHQLYKNHPALKIGRAVYFLEEPLIYGKDREWPLVHHARRLALLKEAGDYYIKALEKSGFEVKTLALGVAVTTTTAILDELPKNLTRIFLCRLVDDLLERRLIAWANKSAVEIEWLPCPNFVSADEWWHDSLDGKKKPFMAHFYMAQRKRMKMLEENGEPVGGRWSFDEDNRKKLPKNYTEPALPEAVPFSDDTKSWVASHFPKAWGIEKNYGGLPRSHSEAEKWFEHFMENRFSLFGDYEDAISTKFGLQQHSMLTPMLNIGLLDPQKITDKALAYAEKTPSRSIRSKDLCAKSSAGGSSCAACMSFTDARCG